LGNVGLSLCAENYGTSLDKILTATLPLNAQKIKSRMVKSLVQRGQART